MHMPKGPDGVKRPADINQLAKMITDIATGEVEDKPSPTPKRAEGGKKGGAARATALPPERRKEISTKAAKARWGN
jgi:hypothetical protein